MGYTTEFRGSFRTNKKFTAEQLAYLHAFASVRHMIRDLFKTCKMEDEVRKAVGLPVGDQGRFYVGGQEEGDITDYNEPPVGVPGLWCQWVPTEDGQGLEWDGGEKFYSYVEWLNFIIVNFLIPWGLELDGRVEFQGEEEEDKGVIEVIKNIVVSPEI